MKIKEFLFSNLLIKVFSFLFALMLWAVVIGEKQAQMTIDVPLDLLNIPGNAVVVNEYPANISVQVQGPRTLLRSLTTRGIRRTIDLTDIGAGWTTFRILPGSIALPRGAEVVRLTPSTVEIKLESVVEVHLPVVPDWGAGPPDGMAINGKIPVDPEKVVLVGAAGELRNLQEIKTQPITLTPEMAETEEVEVRAGLQLEGLHLKSVNPSTVILRVRLVKIMAERAVDNIPVKVVGNDVKAKIEPSKIRLYIKGPIADSDAVNRRTSRSA